MNALVTVFAQTAAPAAGQGAGSFAPFLFQIAAIFAIFYFLMIRPQQKQRKAHEASIMALKKGDQIVTSGGVVGEVLHIKEGLKDGQPAPGLGDHVTIKSGESRLVVTRGRIAAVGGEDPAA
ncbi:MAG: preprotein translocase subunit YajC [Gemmatimonadota bacterium]|nr:preprotein translocase subunit YajC [Gemmatimonadota bacterium]